VQHFGIRKVDDEISSKRNTKERGIGDPWHKSLEKFMEMFYMPSP
jgi:hypothetical protein